MNAMFVLQVFVYTWKDVYVYDKSMAWFYIAVVAYVDFPMQMLILPLYVLVFPKKMLIPFGFCVELHTGFPKMGGCSEYSSRNKNQTEDTSIYDNEL